MNPYQRAWRPDEAQLEVIRRMDAGGATRQQIADAIGTSRSKLIKWWLRSYGSVNEGLREARYSKENMHKTCGIYFDATSLADCLKGERNENG